MESNTGWVFGSSPAQGVYSIAQYHGPSRSARLGITSGSNVNSYSSMTQALTLPVGDQALLKLWVFPISNPYDDSDRQEIRIMAADGTTTLRQLWNATSNANAWVNLQFDISEFMGQSIVLYINVRNDGLGGATAMYVDDVSLEICTSGGPTVSPTSPPVVTVTMTASPPVVTATTTPIIVTATSTPIIVTNTPTSTPTGSATPIFITATPTPIVVTNTPTTTASPSIITATPTYIVVTNTPTGTSVFITTTPSPIVTSTTTPIPIPPTFTPTYTPIPTSIVAGCKECLVNTSFEEWGGWYFGKTLLQPYYTGAQAHSGLRSVLMGNENGARPNYISYSSVRQKVFLPRGEYKIATLNFWRLTRSDGEAEDYQELVILDGNTGATLAVLWRHNLNEGAWVQEQIDLTRYMGKNIIVYFNVYNNGGGGSASMYLDDVTLSICTGVSPQPLPQPMPQPPAVETLVPALPIAPTPEATPTPVVIIILATPTPQDTLMGSVLDAGGTLLGLAGQPIFWMLLCVIVGIIFLIVVIVVTFIRRIGSTQDAQDTQSGQDNQDDQSAA